MFITIMSIKGCIHTQCFLSFQSKMPPKRRQTAKEADDASKKARTEADEAIPSTSGGSAQETSSFNIHALVKALQMPEVQETLKEINNKNNTSTRQSESAVSSPNSGSDSDSGPNSGSDSDSGPNSDSDSNSGSSSDDSDSSTSNSDSDDYSTELVYKYSWCISSSTSNIQKQKEIQLLVFE